MKHDPIPFDILGALVIWLQIVGSLFGIACVLGLLVCLGQYGFRKGPAVFLQQLLTGLHELVTFSPKRVWALTRLSFLDAIRRKVLLVLVVFGVCFLFAGWFMSNPTVDSELRVKIYVKFILTTVSTLSLLPVFLLSCWAIPDDIRLRSLHTVVTKPARRNEIVLGRILGISLVGTLVLAGMAVVSYLWLIRALPEAGSLVSRVPIYGSFEFLDRDGKKLDKGINVGYTNEFRTYIEGNSGSRGVWTFSGVTERLLNAEGQITIECNANAFRTHKGDIEQTLLTEVLFYNPTKKIRASATIFPVQEFHDNVLLIGKALVDDKNNDVDLFKDLVDNGKLTVELACRSTGQFLGIARPDLFIRARNATFAETYFKSMFSTWCLMVLIVVISVTASTILKGPVTFILTLVFLILGVMARSFMNTLVDGTWKAGGPIESIYRLVMHMNDTSDLAKGPGQMIMQGIDQIPLSMVRVVKFVIPDLNLYSMNDFVINRYDVPFNAALLPAICYTVAYFIPCMILGYFYLRARELEAK